MSAYLEESLNDRYRNGGDMNETEPYIPDTIDWFRRAERDPRVVGNQLRLMACLTEDAYEDET